MSSRNVELSTREIGSILPTINFTTRAVICSCLDSLHGLCGPIPTDDSGDCRCYGDLQSSNTDGWTDRRWYIIADVLPLFE